MRKLLFIVLISFCALLITISSSKSISEIAKAADKSSKNYNVREISNFRIKNGKIIKYIGAVKSVTYIGWSAFNGCGFYNIVIPDGIAKIEPYTFSNCINLKSVTIPESVTSIGEDAFAECNNLKTIYGTPGSAADGFAKAAGYTFISK